MGSNQQKGKNCPIKQYVQARQKPNPQVGKGRGRFYGEVKKVNAKSAKIKQSKDKYLNDI